jgi:hypothetical protein
MIDRNNAVPQRGEPMPRNILNQVWGFSTFSLILFNLSMEMILL